MDTGKKLNDYRPGRVEDFFKNSMSSLQKIGFFLTVIILGLLFLWWGGDSGQNADTAQVDKERNILSDGNGLPALEKVWEERLRDSLVKLEGVGEVVVNITLAASGKQIWKENKRQTIRRTEENDASQKRTICEEEGQQEVVLVNSGGNERPLLEEEKAPEIRGALIIAQGAEIYEIKWQITEAVSALTGLPPHRIVVLPMKR